MFPEQPCEVTYDLISDPDYGIPDTAMTASGEHEEFVTGYGGRIDSYGDWLEDGRDGRWISADLGENRIVMAIRIRGHVYYGRHDYITQFTISTSLNGADWSDVVDESESTIVCQDNTDGITIVTNPMPTPIVARHVKLTVLGHVNYATMSWAIDGCPVS